VLVPGDGAPVFVISSLLLHDCFKLLTKTGDESLHALTGLVFSQTRVLERIIPLRLSRQSVAGAEAANESLATELLRLNDFGMLPLAYFHSHPGYGTSATQPSGTDRQTQDAMEKSGGHILGGIFARDRFVRFYANRMEPHVRVVGKRVKEVAKNVYRLETEEDLQE
jgi:proteasome lid subunit RPN8/RPN11